MKKLSICLLAINLSVSVAVFAQHTPDSLYGQLFIDVQTNKIFPDQKTFVDCSPKRSVKDIMYDYGISKGKGMDLKKFVSDNFNVPSQVAGNTTASKDTSAAVHIQHLWNDLKRAADKRVDGSSLLALPNAYIVPGGRFREIYYWDSYFTMIGLKESGQIEMMENMIKNFAYLINTYGHIPNGNRTYYLSRSQPPFFCMMVELLASVKGNQVYATYATSMEKEYNYWMEGASTLIPGTVYKRVVKLPDGTVLNRYWDESATPRQESFSQDVEVGDQVVSDVTSQMPLASAAKIDEVVRNTKAKTWRNLRAGACSGWDFSSRWFEDKQHIKTIETTNIIPVDLNCLLYKMERLIALSAALGANKGKSDAFNLKAEKRKISILKYCWNNEVQYFSDYNMADKKVSNQVMAAGLFPLFTNIATKEQALAVAKNTTNLLLKPGGIVTTTLTTGQQWDAPNGWAPLQWVAVKGLLNYQQDALANDIMHRWLLINDKVYKATGKMMEKYDVVDMTKVAGGGEYPGQDGFGWTNGVYMGFQSLLKNNNQVKH